MALNDFFKSVRSMWLGTYDNYVDLVVPSKINGSVTPFTLEKSESISTLYTCVKILSEAVSRMPLNVYKDDGDGRFVLKEDYRYPILHYNPNGWTNQQTFFASLEYWRNLHGNSFAMINRENGFVSSLTLIKPSLVVGYAVSNGELYYDIKDEGDEKRVHRYNASEILHFKGVTRDGIWGITPIESLRLNLSSTYSGMNTIDEFYKNNAMTPKFIKSTVSGANQKAILQALEEFQRKYSGSNNAGKMAALPPNTELIDSTMSMVDAEFISTIKFNAQQIAAIYGVPPHMVGILESTKYNNVETMQREFMATTLGPILRSYRQELESKLLTTKERINGYSIEFNSEAYFELSTKDRIENLKALQGMGVLSPNQICKIEGYPGFEGGDVHTMPGNYLPVNTIATKTT